MDKVDEKKNISVFNTHKFLFTLNYNGEVKNKKIIYLDRNNEERDFIIEKIEISSSPISCKIYNKEGDFEKVPFFRIKKIFDENGELIWETDNEFSDVKVIKGYK
jgi:hypothetical protein